MIPVDMATYEDLHHEHQLWLSEVTFWQDEINFLKKLCLNFENGNGHSANNCLNQLAHHERLLHGLKQQIIIHENFMKDMIQEDGQPCDGDAVDHQHNRDHIKSFQESYKKLKKEVFQLCHSEA